MKKNKPNLTAKELEELRKDPQRLELLANMIYYTPISLNAAASDMLADFEDELTERGLYHHEIKYRTQLHFKQLERCHMAANARFSAYSTEHLSKVGARFARAIEPDLRKLENATDFQLGRALPNYVDRFALSKAWSIGFIAYLAMQATEAIIRLFAFVTGNRPDDTVCRLLPGTFVRDTYRSADALQKSAIRLYSLKELGECADKPIEVDGMATGMSAIIYKITDPAFMQDIIAID